MKQRLQMETVRDIIERNMVNPAIMRFMRDEHIPSAVMHQMVMDQIRGTRRPSDPRFQMLRDFMGKSSRPPAVPVSLFTALGDIMPVLNAFLNDAFIRREMLGIHFLTYITTPDVFAVYIIKLGRNKPCIAFFNHDGLRYVLELASS